MFCSNMVCLISCTKHHFFPPYLSLSEELLGLHETIQIYYKIEQEVPVRLLNTNSLKHRLTRDVSLFKLLRCSHPQCRSFTKKEQPVFSLEMLFVSGYEPTCYHQGCKILHPDFLTLFCLHITSQRVAQE